MHHSKLNVSSFHSEVQELRTILTMLTSRYDQVFIIWLPWLQIMFLQPWVKQKQQVSLVTVTFFIHHSYTVKKFSDIFPKIVGQLRIQMDRKFFRRYSRKYLRQRTRNSSYCLVGEIFSLLGKIDIFHNLSGKRSKKRKQVSVFVE